MTIRKLDLQDTKEKLATEAHGMTAQEAWSKGICIECKQPAAAKCHSFAGQQEYKISAMCEECFDKLFADGE